MQFSVQNAVARVFHRGSGAQGVVFSASRQKSFIPTRELIATL